MNNYLMYINGRLTDVDGPVKIVNDANGRFAMITFPDGPDVATVKTLDLIEVRAGSMVRQYMWRKDKDKNEKSTFRLAPKANAF